MARNMSTHTQAAPLKINWTLIPLLAVGLLVPFAVVTYPLLTLVGIAALGLVLLGIFRPSWVVLAATMLMPLEYIFLPYAYYVLGYNVVSATSLILIASVGFGLRVLQRSIWIHWTPSLKAFVFFALWSYIGVIWSDYRLETVIRSLYWTTYVSLYAMLLTYMQDSRYRHRIMQAFALTGWFVVISALIMIPGSAGQRLEGLLGNPNSLSTTVIGASLGVFYLLFSAERQTRSLWVYTLLYVALGIICIAFSLSLGGLLAFFILVAGTLLSSRSPVYVLALVTVIAVGLVVDAQFLGLLEQASERLQTGGITLTGRIEIWRIVWRFIVANPILGYGSGTALHLVGIEYASLYNWATPERAVHNPFLEIWMENGIIGLTLYCSVLFLALYPFVKAVFWESARLSKRSKRLIFVILVVIFSYSLVWVKNGGATYDRTIYLMLALTTTLLSSIGITQPRHNRMKATPVISISETSARQSPLSGSVG
jgi:O-antigen ligase